LAGTPLFAPSGQRVPPDLGELTRWTWVDLRTGSSRPLDDLTGRVLYAGYAPGMRWVTFFPSDTAAVDPRDAMLGLDLETGEVQPLLTFDVEATYPGIAPVARSAPVRRRSVCALKRSRGPFRAVLAA
jgi:hypothetical protein